jgi:putative SOS response-associated peptidase YedK
VRPLHHKFTWPQVHALLNLSNAGATLGGAFESHPSFNVAPTQEAMIVRPVQGVIGPTLATWGLNPPWNTSKLAPINARAETVATSGMFRQAFRARRCVVPASGFYEWQKLDDSDRPRKQPWYIYRADGEPMLFAGLYEPRDGKDTFTIITTDANEFMARLHDRVPVVLEPEDAQRWINEGDQSLLRPAADGVLAAHPVSARVNSPKNNDEMLIQPAEPMPPPAKVEEPRSLFG